MGKLLGVMLLVVVMMLATDANAQSSDIASQMQDLERDWQQTNAHQGRCLEFESPQVEAEFHVKMWELRKKFLSHFADKSEIGLLYASSEALLQLWLMAEYGNPGCMSGEGWQPTPGWPTQRVAKVDMTVCDLVTDQCGDWTFTGLYGHAKWESGAESTLKVDPQAGDEIVIHRTDTSGPTAGLTGTYTGSREHHIWVGSYVTSWPGHENSKDVTKDGDWEAKFEMTKAE